MVNIKTLYHYGWISLGGFEVRRYKNLITVAAITALAIPIIAAHPALASDGDVERVQNFIKSIIKVVTSVAGLIAVLYIVIGGIGYISSTGNPEKLDKSKHTVVYAAIGLAIAIGAFVIGNIVTDLATNAFGK